MMSGVKLVLRFDSKGWERDKVFKSCPSAGDRACVVCAEHFQPVMNDVSFFLVFPLLSQNPGFDFSGAQLTGSCPDPSSFLGGMKNT